MLARGTMGHLLAPRIGPVAVHDGDMLNTGASLENQPGFLFDALVLADFIKAVRGARHAARETHPPRV